MVASYVDVTTTTYTPGSNNTATNNTTAVTAVAAPASSTERQIKLMTVYNADTVAATLTLRYNDNGTTRILTNTTLNPGDSLIYTDGEGFRVIDTNGNIKQLAGTTAVAAGGTGATSFTSNAVLKGNGTGAIQASGVSIDSNNNISGYGALINAQTGTTYTLATSDAGKIVEVSNASAITVTLPNNLRRDSIARWCKLEPARLHSVPLPVPLYIVLTHLPKPLPDMRRLISMSPPTEERLHLILCRVEAPNVGTSGAIRY